MFRHQSDGYYFPGKQTCYCDGYLYLHKLFMMKEQYYGFKYHPVCIQADIPGCRKEYPAG